MMLSQKNNILRIVRYMLVKSSSFEVGRLGGGGGGKMTMG